MKKCLMMMLLITLISNTCFAQATKLNKGEAAPFTGILMTKERAEQAAKAEKKVITLEDLRITQEALIEYHREDAMKQRQEVSKAEFRGNMKAIGYFILGTLITSFAFKVAQKTGDI